MFLTSEQLSIAKAIADKKKADALALFKTTTLGKTASIKPTVKPTYSISQSSLVSKKTFIPAEPIKAIEKSAFVDSNIVLEPINEPESKNNTVFYIILVVVAFLMFKK